MDFEVHYNLKKIYFHLIDWKIKIISIDWK
jgi:hypothetical protein